MKRMTRQRAAILKCFAGTERPLSIEEVLEEATAEIPEINLSTVYRNLKVLIEEGKIHAVNLPGNNVRYEVVEKGHHHHFLCIECDKLFNVHGCPKGLHELVPEGFKLLEHSITLNGKCQECAQL